MLNANSIASAVQDEIKKTIIGKDTIIIKVLLGIIAGGHILLDDIPGVGKTTLALSFSKALGLGYNRLQFTPDVLPTDVTGFNIYNRELNTFDYKPGAAFCNLFLADEINRTSSKTQSALLELMEEGNITVDGVTRELPKPYTVIATQNPIGSIGTHMLPESQLDRFMLQLSMGYPDYASEVVMLKSKHNAVPLETIKTVIDMNGLLELQDMSEKVYIDDDIYHYIAKLVLATRNSQYIKLGVSPRGSIAVTNMAKAVACINNRDYVIPSDVSFVFTDVCKHRIIISSRAKTSNTSAASLLRDIIKATPVPQLEAKV
ncbi:MAG: MoxR family ATPase [Oscillospiraceae bacterium]|nr:MoxR family ATPase [Oscillospiraceae bacterium]